jgi:hypothetical protein
MSTPPDTKHYALRRLLRLQLTLALSGQATSIAVPTAELLALLEYMDKQDQAIYDAWENNMGEDL